MKKFGKSQRFLDEAVIVKKFGKSQRFLDEAVIDFVIEDALRGMRRSTQRVRQAQEALRQVTDARGWKAYLVLEEATNARFEKQLQRLFRRMFEIYAARKS